MNNENLDFTDENIIIEYYADGTASITHIVDQNLVEVFTPLTKSDEEAIKNISNAKNQARSAGLILLWQELLSWVNLLEQQDLLQVGLVQLLA